MLDSRVDHCLPNRRRLEAGGGGDGLYQETNRDKLFLPGPKKKNNHVVGIIPCLSNQPPRTRRKTRSGLSLSIFSEKIHIFTFFFERNEAISLTFAALSGGGHIVCLDDDARAEVAVGSHRGAGLDGDLIQLDR